jgi:GDPmannose 4,6-dehydratase
VTRKISDGVARIKLGLAGELRLGNLESRRDWGYAGDYVEAMWQMLQQDTPEEFVIGTGETHSVREFCEIAFGHVDLDYNQFVVQDESFYRPAEVDLLISDPSKARSALGWEPSLSFKELVTMMVDADLERLGSGKR